MLALRRASIQYRCQFSYFTMSNSLSRLSTILKIGNRENATIISHPLTVSIDYPEKRLQENTTYKLEGIILRKKSLLTIYKERRSNKKAGLQVRSWEVQ